MKTTAELKVALRNAHEAGDLEAAKRIATIMKEQKENVAAQQPTPLTKRQQAADVLKSFGSQAYKGLSYIPGTLGDIESLAQEFLPGLKRQETPFTPAQNFPTSEQIRGVAQKIIPPLQKAEAYEPKTTTGRYIGTAAEFASPGILGKTAAAKKLGIGLGAGGGLLYEGVEQATDSPLAAMGVTVPAMITASILAGPSKSAQLTERSLKGVTQPEIKSAIDLEAAAQVAGVKILPGEALDNKMVAQLTEDVLSSDQGSAYIYESIKNRPKQVEKLVTEQADIIADLPESQRDVFKMIQKTAKESINEAKISRTSASQKAGYKVANTENLRNDQVLNVIDNIDNTIKTQTSPNSPNRNKLLQIRKQLIEKTIKVKGQKEKIIIPVTNINKLDSTFKQFRDAVNNSKKDLVTGGERFIEVDLRGKLFNNNGTGILDDLNTQLNTNPNYAKANQTYSQLTKEIVDVVEKNVLPLSKNNLNFKKINGFIFDQKSVNVIDINNTLKTLNQTNPEATKQIANVYFRNAINNAFPISKPGADLTQGFKLAKEIAGTGNQRKNFMAVLDNVADAHGVDRKNFKVGFENMLNILERTGRIQNINKPGFDVQGVAKQTLLKDAAMMKTFNPLVRLSTKYGELKAGGAMANLGKIMANPESTKLLVELGTTNPQSKLAIVKVLNIIDSVSPTMERLEGNVPPLGQTPQ